MGRNWAEEFRRRVEEREGGSRAVGRSADELVEEEAELDEPEDEIDLEEEEEVGREEAENEAPATDAGEPVDAVEKPPEAAPAVPDVGKRAVELYHAMMAKKEPVRSGGSNLGGAMIAVMMGFLVLQSLPAIFNAVSSMCQPLMVSGGGGPQGCYAVSCLYCGYQCLGYNGMPCPRCGRA